jgi:hypothetical protein
MHRHKIIPSILLILFFINFLLAAPVEVRQRPGCVHVAAADVPEHVIFIPESEKRSDELEKRWDEPWQKRAASTGPNPAGEPPADQELATISPPPQTGTSSIQNTASVSSPEIKQPSGENYYPSNEGGLEGSIMSRPPATTIPQGELFPWDPTDWSDTSSEPKLAKNSPPSPQTGTSSIQNTASVSSPEIKQPSGENYYPSDEGGPGGSIMSHPPATTIPQVEPFPWDPTDWSDSSSEPPKEDFMSKAKNFFVKLFHKITFFAGSGCFRCLTG